jgi:hypothetical protein
LLCKFTNSLINKVRFWQQQIPLELFRRGLGGV